jgi:2-polyprenyl-3-methyl-5-hydroxy-6-metoxy-1,4-benzoquinol methylase
MGYRCHTLQDWADAINAVGDLDRRVIADIARAKWSLEACGKRYDKIFCQLNDLYRSGWYELRDISFNQIECEEGPFAKRLADWIAAELAPETVLDIGCGPGTYVRAMRAAGVDAIGIDTDDRVLGQDHLEQRSLFGLESQAELVVCLEVAEHIDPEKTEEIAKCVTDAILPGGHLIWSAAQPGQGGVGHINCRPRSDWEELFAAQGLTRCIETENKLREDMRSGYHMGWFYNNAIVLAKMG